MWLFHLISYFIIFEGVTVRELEDGVSTIISNPPNAIVQQSSLGADVLGAGLEIAFPPVSGSDEADALIECWSIPPCASFLWFRREANLTNALPHPAKSHLYPFFSFS